MTAPAGLYPSLLAAQAEIGTLPKDAINPHFKSKYTPLDTIVEHVGPILVKHGLVWVTKPCRDTTDSPALAYKMVHAGSGETDEGVMPLLLSKSDPQGQGSAITYARRYAICSYLNLVADADDDGEATREAAREGERPARAKSAAKKSTAKSTSTGDAIGPDAVADLARIYAASGWKDTDADDPHQTLRMQLAAVGAGNEGEIVACIKALTVSQAKTVREALQEARDSK